MSTVDKKTLAGLLLGIGAFALAAKKGSKGSRSFFPEPTGKAPKGADGAFTEEQDEVFFAFKQNAPTKSISTKFGPDLDARRQKKRQISQMQDQKSAKQTQLQSIRKTIADNTFGAGATFATLAQVQQEANSIQSQIDNAKNTMQGLEISLQDPMLSADLVDDYENDFNAAKTSLQAAENRLTALNRTLPQAQKTRMQAQATSVSAQIADLNSQISESKAQLATLQDKIRTDSASGDAYTLEEYFNEHTERGYTPEARARYGAGSPGEAAWENWEKQMDLYRGFGGVAQKFTGEQTDTSSIMGQGFKTGVTPLTPQGAFDGEVDNSDPFAPKEFSLPQFK